MKAAVQGAVVEMSSFTWTCDTNIVVPLVRSVSLRACSSAITSARHLILGLFLPAAPEVVHERPAVAASWAADISGKGQLSFRRQHQPWFRSVSSPARAGGLVRPSVRCQVILLGFRPLSWGEEFLVANPVSSRDRLAPAEVGLSPVDLAQS